MDQQNAFPRGTVGFSQFFRKVIKLRHNQMIEGCHPWQFQREIRFYWLGEWLSSTLTQGTNRCSPLVPGLHVLSSEKECVLWFSCDLGAFQLFSSQSQLNMSYFEDQHFFKTLKKKKRPADFNQFPTSGYYIFTILSLYLSCTLAALSTYTFSAG